MLEDQYVGNDDSTLWDDSGYLDYSSSYHMLTDQYTDDESVEWNDEKTLKISQRI